MSDRNRDGSYENYWGYSLDVKQQHIDQQRARVAANEFLKAQQEYNETGKINYSMVGGDPEAIHNGSVMLVNFIGGLFLIELHYIPDTRKKTLGFLIKAFMVLAWEILLTYLVNWGIHSIFPIAWADCFPSHNMDFGLVLLFLLSYFIPVGMALLILIYNVPPTLKALYYFIKGYKPPIKEVKEEKKEPEDPNKITINFAGPNFRTGKPEKEDDEEIFKMEE